MNRLSYFSLTATDFGGPRWPNEKLQLFGIILLNTRNPIHLFRQSVALHWISSSNRLHNFQQPPAMARWRHARAVRFNHSGRVRDFTQQVCCSAPGKVYWLLEADVEIVWELVMWTRLDKKTTESDAFAGSRNGGKPRRKENNRRTKAKALTKSCRVAACVAPTVMDGRWNSAGSPQLLVVINSQRCLTLIGVCVCGRI